MAAVMVTGGIVDYDPQRRTYRLPDAHAACLTRGAPLGNLAVLRAARGAAGRRAGQCARLLRDRPEGLAYDDYTAFPRPDAEDSDIDGRCRADRPCGCRSVPGLADAAWRPGIDVLDAGCGRGGALRVTRRSGFRPAGSSAATCRPRRRRRRPRRPGTGDWRTWVFEQADLTFLDDSGRFDLVTSFRRGATTRRTRSG